MGYNRQVFQKKEDARRERSSAEQRIKNDHYKRSEFKKGNFFYNN